MGTRFLVQKEVLTKGKKLKRNRPMSMRKDQRPITGRRKSGRYEELIGIGDRQLVKEI